MTSVDLRSERMDLDELLHLAEEEAVLVVTADGREFILAEADDFDAEVESLRKSTRFQSFLDQRMKPGARISLEDLEAELQEEMASASSGSAATP